MQAALTDGSLRHRANSQYPLLIYIVQALQADAVSLFSDAVV